MNCSNCNESIIVPDVKSNPIICTRNIAVKQGDTYICNGCFEASMIFCDTSIEEKPKIEVNIKKPSQPATSKYMCVKCKESYEGKVCNKCNTPNPMFQRKPKKQSRKKNKS